MAGTAVVLSAGGPIGNAFQLMRYEWLSCIILIKHHVEMISLANFMTAQPAIHQAGLVH
jgi:hypothetical protein